jgi:group I intron endonuclease
LKLRLRGDRYPSIPHIPHCAYFAGAIASPSLPIFDTPQFVVFELKIALHPFTRGDRCLYLNNVVVKSSMYINSSLNGVYAIHCKINDFIYVGSAASQRGFYARLWTHLHALRKGTHHSSVLQHHYNKYGEDAFEFHILEFCSPAECVEREQAWLDIRGVGYANKSYNIVPKAASQLGAKRSEEIRQRFSNYWKGRPRGPHSKQRSARIKARLSKRAYIATSPDGIEYTVSILSDFCRQYGLRPTRMRAIARGAGRTHKGWTCRLMNESAEIRQKRLFPPNTRKNYIVTLPTGEEVFVDHLASFCTQHGLHRQSMSRVATNKRSHHKGYKCRHADDASKHRPRRRTYIMTAPDGQELTISNMAAFCKQHGLNDGSMNLIANGKAKSYKGWTCRYADHPQIAQLTPGLETQHLASSSVHGSME